jgi:hypothetical protein
VPPNYHWSRDQQRETQVRIGEAKRANRRVVRESEETENDDGGREREQKKRIAEK